MARFAEERRYLQLDWLFDETRIHFTNVARLIWNLSEQGESRVETCRNGFVDQGRRGKQAAGSASHLPSAVSLFGLWLGFVDRPAAGCARALVPPLGVMT